MTLNGVTTADARYLCGAVAQLLVIQCHAICSLAVGDEFHNDAETCFKVIRKVALVNFYRVVQKKNCTKFNALSFCNRLQHNHAVFIKILKRDHSLPLMQKLYQSVKYSLMNSRNWDWIHVTSDITLHVNWYI